MARQEAVPAQPARRYAPFPRYEGVPVLAYRDVVLHGTRHGLDARRFAAQMEMLARSGFTPITAARLVAYLRHGAALPARPVLLTFDGGFASAWRLVDPILAEHGFHAVLFLVTGELERRPYLTRPEARHLLATGRWELESQTHLGVGDVRAGRRGPLQPFLVNRRWLARVGRVETRAEFGARVGRDLDRSIAELRALGTPRPRLFAFPRRPRDEPTNDGGLAGVVRSLVASRFTLALETAPRSTEAFAIRTAPAGELPRFAVDAQTTVGDLLARLRRARPLPPLLRDGLARPSEWVVDGSPREALRRAAPGGGLVLDVPPKTWRSARWSPARTVAWRDYSVKLHVASLGPLSAPANATLTLRDGGTGPRDSVAITVSAGYFRITGPRLGAWATLREGRLAGATAHAISARVAGSRFRIAIDGRTLFDARLARPARGGIGLGVWRTSSASSTPVFARLQVRPIPDE